MTGAASEVTTLRRDTNANIIIIIIIIGNEVSRSRLLKVRAQTGQTDRHRRTDRRDRTHYRAAFASGEKRGVCMYTACQMSVS